MGVDPRGVQNAIFFGARKITKPRYTKSGGTPFLRLANSAKAKNEGDIIEGRILYFSNLRKPFQSELKNATKVREHADCVILFSTWYAFPNPENFPVIDGFLDVKVRETKYESSRP